MSFLNFQKSAVQRQAQLNISESKNFENVTVISRNGPYEGSAEERNLICLLSDGRLLIVQGQELNSLVLSYRARLEKMHRPYRVIQTDIETIAGLYRNNISNTGNMAANSTNHNARRNTEHSMMQVTAKDLLTKACDARASDVHIRVKKNSTEIYFRIHNDLVRTGGQTRDYGERLLATIYGAMASVSDSSYKPTERQDASIADRDKLPQSLYGVRIATAPTSDGMVMVLRLLYNDAGDTTDLRPLGFSDMHAAMMQQLKEQPVGINIISGPTGSGKSTTLQRVLSGEILEADGKIHVLTVEDPVEYPIEGAVQTAVTNASTEADRSRMFSAAIANAMRLDPDTIMIGEMRDQASAQSALRAAMTGHQVWSTVHANSAMAIIDRLIDLGLPMSLVADHAIITGLISQRLVKILCPDCKKSFAEHQHTLSPSLVQRVTFALGGNTEKVCIAGDGCETCRHQGTTGRTVICEVIIPDAQFFDHIRAGEKVKAAQHWQHSLNGKTIVEHALDKVAQGLIDPSMAEKVIGHLTINNHSSQSSQSTTKRLNVMEAARAV